MTPLHWQMLLHYYAIAEPYAKNEPGHANSLAVREYTLQLQEWDLIKPDPVSASDAAKAYDAKARELFGANVTLNFPTLFQESDGGVESRHAAKQAGATWPQASNEGGSAPVTSLRGSAEQRGSREWLEKDGSHEVPALRLNPPSLAGVATGPSDTSALLHDEREGNAR